MCLADMHVWLERPLLIMAKRRAPSADSSSSHEPKNAPAGGPRNSKPYRGLRSGARGKAKRDGAPRRGCKNRHQTKKSKTLMGATRQP